MSEDALNPRSATYHGVNDICGWRVKLYSFAAPGVSAGDSLEYLAGLAGQCLANFEESGISDEFTYLRFGFVICHLGRRGITVSLIHFGLWDDMPEVFAASWYCYGHSGKELERLDFREPLTCVHEIPTMLSEIQLFREIVYERAQDAAGISWEEVASSYLNSGAAGHESLPPLPLGPLRGSSRRQ
jgi:hypothetical protein